MYNNSKYRKQSINNIKQNVEIVILKQSQHACLKMCCYTCKALQKCFKKSLKTKCRMVYFAKLVTTKSKST